MSEIPEVPIRNRDRSRREDRYRNPTVLKLTRRDVAIAISTFVIVMTVATVIFTRQRHDDFDKVARQDLLALAAMQNEFLLDNPSSYATIRQLISPPYNWRAHGEAITVKSFDANRSYCLHARSRSGTDYFYDSRRAAILPVGESC